MLTSDVRQAVTTLLSLLLRLSWDDCAKNVLKQLCGVLWLSFRIEYLEKITHQHTK